MTRHQCDERIFDRLEEGDFKLCNLITDTSLQKAYVKAHGIWAR